MRSVFLDVIQDYPKILPPARTAIGKANLLVTKKFKQFRGLCDDCIRPPPDEPLTKPRDLLGFWEMVQIQIEEVDAAFSKIDTLRQQKWTGPGTPDPLFKRCVNSVILPILFFNMVPSI
jgi:hypothetical protein